jgi:F-type H+-transporting ATPase subunit b
VRRQARGRAVLLQLAIVGILVAPFHRAWSQEPTRGQVSTSEAGQSSRPAAQSGEASQGEASRGDASQEERDENEEYRQSPVVKMLGSKMGMKPAAASMTFDVVNFAILAVALGWFLARALPKAFRNRTTVIQKHLVDARTATEEASIRLNSVEDRLSKLDEQIAAMRSQAEKDAVGEEQRIRASVEEEKQKVLQSAEQEIAAATMQARRDIQRYAAELAVDQAARKLVVSAETDRLLIDSFARRLGGADSTEGKN